MRNILTILLMILSLSACQRKAEERIWTTVMEAEISKVSALSGGRIDSILVAEGDEVQAGDIIARLDDKELRFNLEQLQASIRELAAQKELYKSQIELAKADLQYQNSKQSRNESLYNEDYIPRQQFEDGEILRKKAELQHESAGKNLRVVEAKREALEAQIKNVQKKIEDCVIKSAFSGRVENVFFNEGEMLPNMGQLAEIINSEQMEANIYVSEEYLSVIKPGQSVKLKVNGYRQDLPATLIRISNRAEFTPKTVLTPDNRRVRAYAVRLRAENPDGILKDGMPVDVYLP